MWDHTSFLAAMVHNMFAKKPVQPKELNPISRYTRSSSDNAQGRNKRWKKLKVREARAIVEGMSDARSE